MRKITVKTEISCFRVALFWLKRKIWVVVRRFYGKFEFYCDAFTVIIFKIVSLYFSVTLLP